MRSFKCKQILSAAVALSMILSGTPVSAIAEMAEEAAQSSTEQVAVLSEPDVENLQDDLDSAVASLCNTVAGEDETQLLSSIWDAFAALEVVQNSDEEENITASTIAALQGSPSTSNGINHALFLVASNLGLACEEGSDDEGNIVVEATIGESTFVLNAAAGERGVYPWADLTESEEESAEQVEQQLEDAEGDTEELLLETEAQAEAEAEVEVEAEESSEEPKEKPEDVLSAQATKTSLSSATIKVSDQLYSGATLKPSVVVTMGSKTLAAGSDYSVAYSNNKNAGTATVTVTGKGSYTGSKSAKFKIVKPSVSYGVHVQTIGDQGARKDGVVAGTSGQSKRLESIKISLGSGLPVSGGVTYRTHVQSYGWETSWKSNGAESGTHGQSKRLEAIQIKLTGELSKHYDVYYRVHAQNLGWMSWAKNGEVAGTSNVAWRLEAIQVILLPKGTSAPESLNGVTSKIGYKHYSNPGVTYQTHVQTHGWLNWVKNGQEAGTTGEQKRLEGLKVKLGSDEYSGGIRYCTHVQGIGWQDWVTNGDLSGTSGQSKRLEGFRVELTGELAEYFDVWYCCHVQTYGWLDWAKNGQQAGTEGLSKRMESLCIKILPKGYAAPGSTEQPFIDKDPCLSGDAELDAMIGEFIGQTGTGYDGLRRAYDIISTYPYSSGNRWPGPDWQTWSIPYAKEMYINKTGNCYRYASLMCWTARRLGYDAKVVPGWIPGRVNPRCDHGWVEVLLDGQTYIIDAEMNGDDGYPQYNWFMIKYADAHLRYYDLNDNRILK